MMIALAGAACLGSIASMAIPTRMAMAEQQARGLPGADRAFADTPAYYVEPGPQDLVPASYAMAGDTGPAWEDLRDAAPYRGSWLYSAPQGDLPHTARTAADGEAQDPAATHDESATAVPAMGPAMGPASADAPADLAGMPQDGAPPSPAVQVAGSGPQAARAPQQVAVIEVPAPQ